MMDTIRHYLTACKAFPFVVYRISNKAMLTGEKLGEAIAQAITMKGVTKADVARHFEVKPPSVQGWIKKGRIGKERLGDLFSYFADVCGPDHWGLTGVEKEYLADGMTLDGYISLVRTTNDVTAGDAPSSRIPPLSEQHSGKTSHRRMLPVIEWNDAPEFSNATALEYITTTEDETESAVFVVTMPDDSMSQSIPRGWRLYVAPGRPLFSGGAFLFKTQFGVICRRVSSGVSGWLLTQEDGRNSPAETLPNDAKVIGYVEYAAPRGIKNP